MNDETIDADAWALGSNKHDRIELFLLLHDQNDFNSYMLQISFYRDSVMEEVKYPLVEKGLGKGEVECSLKLLDDLYPETIASYRLDSLMGMNSVNFHHLRKSNIVCEFDFKGFLADGGLGLDSIVMHSLGALKIPLRVNQ